MADFHAALRGLASGRLSQASLIHQLHRGLARSPAAGPALRTILDTEHTAGKLTESHYRALCEVIAEYTAVSPPPRDSDSTRLTSPSRTHDASSNPAGYPTSDPTSDPTVITGSANRPRGKGHGPRQKTPSAPGDDQGSDEGGDGDGLGRLAPGMVIKQRFVLDALLGTGGMGKVFKARDLLKLEASDHNPHVALKFLSEDFERRPEAFVALQRESSRQQRLAHPNIATVYDFDRVGTSRNHVFITMEYLEGVSLEDYIRREVKPARGLAFAKAYPLLRDLALALDHAHGRGIVHCDLKPANAFLCDNGTVKVLDFGIARAVEDTQAAVAAGGQALEGTALDAMTPAYASMEMLQGDNPDPRDDIYALACVSYELLTGRHPFDRYSALEARERGLVVSPVPKLKARQQRALRRGLAWARKDRPRSAGAFVEQLAGRLNWYRNPWLVGGALAAVAAVGAVEPVYHQLQERRIQSLAAELEQGTADSVAQVLRELPALSPIQRERLLNKGQETITRYFDDRIREAVYPARAEYDFTTAERLLASGQALYPASPLLNAARQRVGEIRDQRLNELNQKVIAVLTDGSVAGGDSQPLELAEIKHLIAVIEPGHPVIQEPNLHVAYQVAVQDALNLGHFRHAGDYLARGLEFAGDDSSLRAIGAESSGPAVMAPPSEAPCTVDLAGLGLQARAVCFDVLKHRVRGPLLVVIPADDGAQVSRGVSYAMGKLEISINDYNRYCFLSGQCSLRLDTDGNLPLTGITLAEAKAYLAWLSARTGRTYRLPLGAEWTHAAWANGRQPPDEFNCLVTIGEEVRRGGRLVPVMNGLPNGWGMRHYLGNAREWVMDGEALRVRGGGYNDPAVECSITFERTHDGGADAATGFRVLREIPGGLTATDSGPG